MSFKKMFLPAVLVMSVLSLAAAPVLAGHGKEGKSCPISGGGYGKSDCGKGGCGKSCESKGSCGKGRGMGMGCSHASSHCPIASKFCGKVCWILEHKTELGLTDEQVSQIKALDVEVEKNSIRGVAEMKVFALEMEQRLSQPTIDVEGIESMIDSGMAGMATGAKATVKAYAQLKSIVTEEQIAKAKELKKSGHAGHHHHGA